MSLRARLLLAVLTLAAAGLIVADVVTYTLLNNFLTGRLDQQLVTAIDPTARFLANGGPSEDRQPNGRGPGPGGGGAPGGGGPAPGTPGTYAALVNTQGQVTAQITFGLTASQQALQPKLPNPLPTPRGGSPAFLTAPSQDGQDSYRVAVGLSDQGQEVVIAIPRTDIESTLNRLLLVEAGVGAGVLLVLGAVGAYAVRLGLRPLDRIGATAGRIAAGDLQQRVTPATPKTEVGRLGLALNAMLEKIEEAFAARRASEERLRRFVSDASHELRTPVASIRGYAELFRRGAKANPE
ncbi:MAG TPA: HAMP domain-containing protein, partial [Chloroflexota bacterium]|nr:HAMP domain-containing protein [Chloroflexota bacterium]